MDAIGGIGYVRAMKCSAMRREAIEEGCRQRHTKGKCGPIPEKMYKNASEWLCGWRTKAAYDWGCDPNFVSKPIFGKPLCAKWERKTKKNKRGVGDTRRKSRRSTTRRQRR